MPASRVSSRAGAIVLLAATWLAGCGAGTPLMHPAHTLERHRVRAGAGASQYLVFGPTNGAIARSRELGTLEGVPDEQREEFVEGAVAYAAATPALAPWVGARAGLGGGNEMGLSYTGRRVRGDLRHAFELDDIVLSVGGGLGAILPDLGSGTPRTGGTAPDEVEGGSIRGFDGSSISGWTIDVPVLLGARSRPEVVSTWIGVHALYERFSADLMFDFGPNETPVLAPADGSRFFAGAVAGFSVGLRPLWAVIEVTGGYQSLSSEVAIGQETFFPSLDGFSLTPSFAVVADLD